MSRLFLNECLASARFSANPTPRPPSALGAGSNFSTLDDGVNGLCVHADLMGSKIQQVRRAGNFL